MVMKFHNFERNNNKMLLHLHSYAAWKALKAFYKKSYYDESMGKLFQYNIDFNFTFA